MPKIVLLGGRLLFRFIFYIIKRCCHELFLKVYKKLTINRLLSKLKTIRELIMAYVYYVWHLLCRLNHRLHVAERTEIIVHTEIEFELNENVVNELCSDSK